MVSFQCHGCGDVVKKPKLDQHRSRCFTGFDCIDCSKTFKSPAEYKGHTSCISEAEKYQKGLYKGPKTGESLPNSSLNNKDTTHPVSRQSNAQWSRNSQPTSLDNINGYPGLQHQHSQNGWRNGRDSHRYSERGRKGSNWQQNRFTGSSASGANDTPLGNSRREDPVVVNGGTSTFEPGHRTDGVSQRNSHSDASKAKGKPTKEKRKPNVVTNTDNCSSRTAKEVTTEPDTAETEKKSAVIHNDVKEPGMRKRKKEMNDEVGTTTAEADTEGSDIKGKRKKEKRLKEKEVDKEHGLADADTAGEGDKQKTKKVETQTEVADELNSVDEGDAGKKMRKKEKRRKAKKANDDDEAETTVVDIPPLADEQTKKRKKKGTTDEFVGDSDTPVVEIAAAKDGAMSAPVHDQTTKRKKRTATTIPETTEQLETDEKDRRRREEDIQQKGKKRKRHGDLNDSATEKRRKSNS